MTWGSRHGARVLTNSHISDQKISFFTCDTWHEPWNLGDSTHGKMFPVDFPLKSAMKIFWVSLTHDGSMYAIYGNMDPINIPPMLAYIPAPWIRHGLYFQTNPKAPMDSQALPSQRASLKPLDSSRLQRSQNCFARSAGAGIFLAYSTLMEIYGKARLLWFYIVL